jgi:hypothetical protein
MHCNGMTKRYARSDDAVLAAVHQNIDRSPSRRRYEARSWGVRSYADAHDLASSAARDAGQHSALKAGRISWTDDEWTVAAATMHRVMQTLGYAIQGHVAS